MANTIITIKQTEKNLQMISDGEFNIQNSSSIKSFLLESLSRSGNEILILSDVAAFDVSAIQLVYAWKKELEMQGRTANVLFPISESLKDLLEKAGITKIL
jgi:anti-anti-sigma regulatory factor